MKLMKLFREKVLIKKFDKSRKMVRSNNAEPYISGCRTVGYEIAKVEVKLLNLDEEMKEKIKNIEIIILITTIEKKCSLDSNKNTWKGVYSSDTLKYLEINRSEID